MRAWASFAIVLAACGGSTAGRPPVERPPPATAGPASRYFLVEDAHEISEGSTARSGPAVIVRAPLWEGRDADEDGEPWFASLDSLASEIFERVNEGDGEGEEQVADELARAACESDERIPRELRVGAPVDVLGAGGWERASIASCTSYQHGHYLYFGFFLDHAPSGATLARVELGAPAEGTYTPLPGVLPSPTGQARASLNEQLTRLGLTGAFLSARAEDLGTFELPDGRVLVHLGVPNEDEESEAEGRAVCGAAGSCIATAILSLGESSGEATLVHGSSDDEVSAELDGYESGAWRVLGVFRDGSASGLVSVYEDLGSKIIVVTRWRDGVREDQTIYTLVYG